MVCDDPGSISNGYSTSTKARYGLREVVGFICHEGYSLVGSPAITCNGTDWSEKPECSSNIKNDDHGYPTGAKTSYKKDDEVGYICHDGYTSVGSPTATCNGTHWVGGPKCSLDFIDDVWFWLLLCLGLFITIAVITALCLYCTKRHRYRRNRVGTQNSEEGDYVGCCGGCCDYGGSCDTCGCIDYYGCCALYGCCGYLGVCSWFCGCCRCCREPLESHYRRGAGTGNVFFINNHNATPRIDSRWESNPKRGRLSKKTLMRLKKKRRMLKNQKHIDRVENPMNDEVYSKVRKEAKQISAWIPHSHPVRNINSSTK